MYQRFAGMCCSRIGTCFIEQFPEVDGHVGLSGMMGFPSETCRNDGRYCLVIHERRPTRQAGNNSAHDDCSYVIDSLLVRYTNGLPDVLRASRRSARPASGKRFRTAVARRRRRSTARGPWRGHRAPPPLLPLLASCSLKGRVSSPPVPARQGRVCELDISRTPRVQGNTEWLTMSGFLNSRGRCFGLRDPAWRHIA